MRSQLTKEIYWLCLGPLASSNRWLKRKRFDRRIQERPRYLQLGSGTKKSRHFLNIDINLFSKPDIWLDMTKGLPFPDASIQGAYSCHVFEHLPYTKALDTMEEVYRVLANGAGVRIVVPSLEKAILAYTNGDAAWFSDWPDSRRSLGGRLNNYLLCRDQHKLMFDYSLFEELSGAAGFRNVLRADAGISQIFSAEVLEEIEGPEREEMIKKSLIVEVIKE